jgi:hypothetical protein
MTKHKNLFIQSVLFLLMAFSLPLVAEDHGDENIDMEILKQKVEADKKLLVSGNMNLTQSEAKAFWPIYDEYQTDLQKINKSKLDVILRYADAYNQGAVSDATAKGLLSDYLDIEQSIIEMKKAYMNRLSRVIPAAKAVRYIQIENKISAVEDLVLADQIPLVD